MESAPEIRTAHIHVVPHHSSQWRNYLRFRDLLRADSDVRRQYAVLKQGLHRRYADNRKAYTASKHDFIRGLLAE